MLCRLGVLIMYKDVCDKDTLYMCMWYKCKLRGVICVKMTMTMCTCVQVLSTACECVV